MAALTKHGGSSKIHPTVVETQSLQSAQCSASEDAANTIPEGAVQRALDGLAHDRERAHAVKKNAVGLLIEMVNLWFKRSASNTEKPLFAFTQWTMAGYLLGWREAATRMSTEAATFGVLSALLAGLIFPSLLSLPEELQADDEESDIGAQIARLRTCYSVSAFMSISFALCDLVTSATTMMQLNVCSCDADIREFIMSFEELQGLNFALFAMALLCALISAWTVLAARHDAHTAIAVTVVMAALMVTCVWRACAVYLGFSLPKLFSHYQLLTAAAREAQQQSKEEQGGGCMHQRLQVEANGLGSDEAGSDEAGQ